MNDVDLLLVDHIQEAIVQLLRVDNHIIIFAHISPHAGHHLLPLSVNRRINLNIIKAIPHLPEFLFC